MTTFSIGCWVVLNIIITYVSFIVVQWADFHLFTYLGEAEITPGHWEMCFMYDTLTIPARIFAFGAAVLAMFITIAAWGSFIGIVLF